MKHFRNILLILSLVSVSVLLLTRGAVMHSCGTGNSILSIFNTTASTCSHNNCTEASCCSSENSGMCGCQSNSCTTCGCDDDCNCGEIQEVDDYEISSSVICYDTTIEYIELNLVIESSNKSQYSLFAECCYESPPSLHRASRAPPIS